MLADPSLAAEMKFHLKLWLLIGVFLVIGRCEEGDEAGDGDHGEEVAEEGHEEFGEDGDGEGAEPMDDDEASEAEEDEPFEPLTSDQARKLHKKMDANGNGQVSMAEVNEFAQKMRRAMAKMELDDVIKGKDLDHDHKLNYQEFLGDPGQHPEETQNEKAAEFRELDANNDKLVDEDELTHLFQHHTNDKVEDHLTREAMKDKDTDKNGELSLTEFYQHLQVEDEDPVEISDEEKDIFNKLDMDNSGTISLKELKAWESGSFNAEEAVKKIFERADKNKDNVITADELDGAREAIADDPSGDAQMYLMQWVEPRHGEL